MKFEEFLLNLIVLENLEIVHRLTDMPHPPKGWRDSWYKVMPVLCLDDFGEPII